MCRSRNLKAPLCSCSTKWVDHRPGLCWQVSFALLAELKSSELQDTGTQLRKTGAPAVMESLHAPSNGFLTCDRRTKGSPRTRLGPGNGRSPDTNHRDRQKNTGVSSWGTPFIFRFSMIFDYKPSIWGYHH